MRQEEIDSNIRSSCDKKFWKTHYYDYVKVKYFDPKKQDQYLQDRAATVKTQGVAQESRYPHR
jgi:hypothetical protein